MFLPIISVLFAILLFVYALLLAGYRRRFRSVPIYLPETPVTRSVSVVIPARNEENNISRCINAIRNQDYNGQVEIIVADDHSTDNTASIAGNLGARVIPMGSEQNTTTVAFKKQALEAGIRHSKCDLILTTDADCIAPHRWIRLMVSRLQEQGAVMVAGPVRMVPDQSFLSRFQSMDFAILQGITAASVHSGFHDMSSGANLCYLKQAFNQVDGFAGIDDIATGDDMLLMQKFSERYPGQISYAFTPEAIVDTATEPSWGAFLRQRIRWASKARRYRDKRIFRILLLVYLLNLILLVMMATSFLGPDYFVICLLALFLKAMAEWNFVSDILKFFSLQQLLPLFPLSQPLHVVYTVLSGTFGQLGPVEWKGRKVK